MLMYGEESLELTRHNVLKRDIPWETYLTARLISDRDLQLIRRYDKRNAETQQDLLTEASLPPTTECLAWHRFRARWHSPPSDHTPCLALLPFRDAQASLGLGCVLPEVLACAGGPSIRRGISDSAAKCDKGGHRAVRAGIAGRPAAGWVLVSVQCKPCSILS